jgi:hypothetical protein
MAKARVLIDEVLFFHEGRFVAEVKVFEVPVSDKFPDGIKVRCVLVDSEAIAHFTKEATKVVNHEEE